MKMFFMSAAAAETESSLGGSCAAPRSSSAVTQPGLLPALAVPAAKVSSEPLHNAAVRFEGVVTSRFLPGTTTSKKTEFHKVYIPRIMISRSFHALGLSFPRTFWLRCYSETLMGKVVDSVLIFFTFSWPLEGDVLFFCYKCLLRLKILPAVQNPLVLRAFPTVLDHLFIFIFILLLGSGSPPWPPTPHRHINISG